MAQQLYFSRDSKLFVEWSGTTGLWEVPILDGFSFSQATNSSEITLAEMESTGGASRRGRRLFNDSLAPVEWSFSTYMRPFKSAGNGGASDADSAVEIHSVEEVLWALMAASDTYSSYAFTRGANAVSGPVITPSTTSSAITFAESNRSVLPTATLYFFVNTSAANPVVYKITNAAVNEASIDFDVDGIATINWSGFGKEIADFSGSVHRDATLPIYTDTTVDGTTIAVGDVWIDSDNDDAFHIMTNVGDGTEASRQAIDEGTSATNNFIRNRLTQLAITADDTTVFPGASSNGVYNLTLTGGNITITNNLTYLVPEELGIVNKPIENITGARTVTGSFTCYLSYEDTGNSGTSTDFFNDLTTTTALEKVVNAFDLVFKIGGATTDNSVPAVQFHMDKAHIEIPAHSIEDVISLETTFHGLGESIGDTDEVAITYYGPTPA